VITVTLNNIQDERNQNKRIRTTLYGDQQLSIAELEVIHTPAMQRLYGLKQLGLTDRVYIDASHSRIHHVVGVLHLVDIIVDSIISNLLRRKGTLKIGSCNGGDRLLSVDELIRLVKNRRPVIRFIGLLHDLTHAPFGHTVEDEIKLVVSKHDDPDRQSDAFYLLLCQLVAWLSLESHGPKWSLTGELERFLSQGAGESAPQGAGRDLPAARPLGEMARELICGLDESKAKACLKMGRKEMADMFAQLCCAMTALLHLEALHNPQGHQADAGEKDTFEDSITEGTDRFHTFIQAALGGSEFADRIEDFRFEPRSDAFMLDIVGNTVCADLLDYARRDSHFAGLRLSYDAERIAENFTLASVDALAYEINHQKDAGARRLAKVTEGKNPFEGWCLRTAIALFSHKYRTDIPGELMNLLNVRFYLYERVIFHPTKCAAGSMLGTALQLLGWRKHPPNAAQEPPKGTAPEGEDGSAASKKTNSRVQDLLPSHLRLVGDDVFLHDVGCALGLALGHLSAAADAYAKGKSKTKPLVVDRSLIGATGSADTAKNGLTRSLLDGAHNGLVHSLLELRLGQSIEDAIEELRAARLLLRRLASRRYFRPVFRALASTKDPKLQAGAEILADLFRDPNVRFNAEREIERRAELDKGTVTIHCPVRNTAQKIANVFLTKPGGSGADIHDEVWKLKHIGSLDKEIFGDHEAAVTAVERMYRSMWRLMVYVAPEHIEGWEDIEKVAGQVIFEAVDRHKHFGGQLLRWENDQNLLDELADKVGRRVLPEGGPGRAAAEQPVDEPAHEGRHARAGWVATSVKAYLGKRIDDAVLEKVRTVAWPDLLALTPEGFESFQSRFEGSIRESENLGRKSTMYREDKKWTFEQVEELVNIVLKSLQPTSASAEAGLFGEFVK
jgi:HD superfamily phosphohydrolase